MASDGVAARGARDVRHAPFGRAIRKRLGRTKCSQRGKMRGFEHLARGDARRRVLRLPAATPKAHPSPCASGRVDVGAKFLTELRNPFVAKFRLNLGILRTDLRWAPRGSPLRHQTCRESTRRRIAQCHRFCRLDRLHRLLELLLLRAVRRSAGQNEHSEGQVPPEFVQVGGRSERSD